LGFVFLSLREIDLARTNTTAVEALP